MHFGPVQARRVNFEASFRSRGRDVGCEGGDAEVYNEVVVLVVVEGDVREMS